MRKKIFRSMSMVALFAIISVALISTFIYYKNFEKRIRTDARNITALIKNSVEDGGIEFLREMENRSDYRITYISRDGSVLYDSQISDQDLDSMSNHMDRPEVISAVNTGEGSDIRTSHTLSQKTYYYAEKLSDGAVLRIAISEKSEMASLIEMIPGLLGITFLVMLLAFGFSRFLTKKIVAPINRVNFDDNDNEDSIYDELYPFVQKIKNQKKVIEEQIMDIRSSRGEFEAITENMGEGLIVIDKNENVLSYNKSAMQLLDIGVNSGRLRNFVAFTRNEGILKQVEQALEGKRSESLIHIHQKVYQVVSSPVVIDGEVNGAVVIIFDETEKEQRDELRREFSANVSHELKTPLTSISGYAEIMETGMVKEEDMIKFSGIIHSEAMRLINLVEDIIKISRLDDSQVQLEKEEVNLSDVIADNINYLKKLAEKKHVSIVKVGTDGIVYGVRQILDEMVHNIIENAIKYNKENGSVIVSVDTCGESDHENQVVLTVKDTGIGIPQNDIERVFERFYRVDKSHSKAIGGTGLGLSIVKHGAIYHDAKIQVDSEIDRGTTIAIIFHGMKKSPQE